MKKYIMILFIMGLIPYKNYGQFATKAIISTTTGVPCSWIKDSIIRNSVLGRRISHLQSGNFGGDASQDRWMFLGLNNIGYAPRTVLLTDTTLYGLAIQTTSDKSFFGQRRLGNDSTQTIIAFGDNGPIERQGDRLIFEFQQHNVTTQSNYCVARAPVEIATMTPALNVGIGLSAPTAKLHIDVSNRLDQTGDTGTGIRFQGLQNSTDDTVLTIDLNGNIHKRINKNMACATANFVPKVNPTNFNEYICSQIFEDNNPFTRNVGIGTTNPQSKLTVQAENNSVIEARSIQWTVGTGVAASIRLKTQTTMGGASIDSLDISKRFQGATGATMGVPNRSLSQFNAPSNVLINSGSDSSVYIGTSGTLAARFTGHTPVLNSRFLLNPSVIWNAALLGTSNVIGVNHTGSTSNQRLRITSGNADDQSSGMGASIDLHGNNTNINRGRVDLVAGMTANGANKAFSVFTNTTPFIQSEKMTVLGNGNVGVNVSAPTDRFQVGGTATINSLPAAAANERLVLANTAGQLHSLAASGNTGDYLSGNGTWQTLPASGGISAADQGCTSDGTTVVLGDECGRDGGQFQVDREVNMNQFNLYFHGGINPDEEKESNGKVYMGGSIGQHRCRPLFSRLELSAAGIGYNNPNLSPRNDYVSPNPSPSGLRFTDLTAASNTIPNKTKGVLSLDEDGDVIWVEDNVGNVNITNTLASSANIMSSNVSGNLATAPIINTNVLTLTGNQLTSTVNGVTSNVITLPAGTGAITANNGVSVNPANNVTLGQNSGQTGNPASLSSLREIPMNNFDIVLTDNTTTGDQGRFGLGTNNPAAKLDILIPSNRNDGTITSALNVSNFDEITTGTRVGAQIVTKSRSNQSYGLGISSTNNGTNSNTDVIGVSVNSHITSSIVASKRTFGGMFDVKGGLHNYGIHTISDGLNNGLNSTSGYFVARGSQQNTGVQSFVNAPVGSTSANYGFNAEVTGGGNNRGIQIIAQNGDDNFGISTKASNGFRSFGGNFVAENASFINIGVNASATGTNAFSGYFNGASVQINTQNLLSDVRVKKDIKPIKNALDIINSIQPKSYHYDNTEYPGLNLNTERISYGVIAQELEKVLPSLVNEIPVPKKTNPSESGKGDLFTGEKLNAVNYTELIPFAIQAIKELDAKQKENESLKSEVDMLKEKFALLEKSIAVLCESGCAGLKSAGGTTNSEVDALYQSIPNPTDDVAFINYYLTREYKDASITLTTQDGKKIQSFKLDPISGNGMVKVSLGNLASGTYFYTFVAGERVVDTKRLQIVK